MRPLEAVELRYAENWQFITVVVLKLGQARGGEQFDHRRIRSQVESRWDSTYPVTQAQSNLPPLIKQAADAGPIVITRHDKTVAYLISRERIDAILQTLEVIENSAAMKAIRDCE